jgi:signal transduction histidine kinase
MQHYFCGPRSVLARLVGMGLPDGGSWYSELLQRASCRTPKNCSRCSAGKDFRSSSRNSDDARRRLERDLHDGAQQQLVALDLGLRAADACVPDELQPLKARIAGLVTTAAAVSNEVQEISRGIHPAILSKGGLGPALKTLARRSAVLVDLGPITKIWTAELKGNGPC